MKLGRRGIAKTAMAAIAAAVVVVAVVAAVFLLKPGLEVLPTPSGQVTPTPSGGQVTPTPTAQPTATPTEQVTPTPAEEVVPKTGAILIGPINISGKASSGTINFTISEDGASITWMEVTLNDVDVDLDGGAITADSISTGEHISIPIAGGAFSGSVDSIGEIEGRFTSSTEASGTIDLILVIYQAGAIEFGTFNWSAKAE